jgi:cytochrome c oxidase subunit 3
MMVEKIHISQKETTPLVVNPKKFILWLFIVTIVMLFAALTSAYIVKRADGGWLEFPFPPVFWVNTGVILLSSITIQWAYSMAKKDNLSGVKLALLITTFLGLAFLAGQEIARENLQDMGVFFGGKGSNPAGSYLYVFAGLHAFHLVTGLVFLLITLGSSLKHKVHSKNLNQLALCATYWHFLDLLWIYLFVFLLLNH